MKIFMNLINWFFFIKESKFVKAEYDFWSDEPGDLSFVKDDIITTLEQIDENWWKGSLNVKIGIFPANVSLFIKKKVNLNAC